MLLTEHAKKLQNYEGSCKSNSSANAWNRQSLSMGNVGICRELDNGLKDGHLGQKEKRIIRRRGPTFTARGLIP